MKDVFENVNAQSVINFIKEMSLVHLIITFAFIFLPRMTLNSLFCADVPLRTYSLSLSLVAFSAQKQQWSSLPMSTWIYANRGDGLALTAMVSS